MKPKPPSDDTPTNLARRRPRPAARGEPASMEPQDTTLPDVPVRTSSPIPDFAPGSHVGRYVIQGVLGQGGMGSVYLAHDPDLDRRVAIKLLHPSLSGSAENQARLLREARAMARVSHPHVVAVHDLVTWQGQLFVAMEYVEDTTLREWLRTRRSPRQILELFRKAGAGLAAAHAAGLIHRDFKPSNVLIGTDGSVQVSDFGLARAQDATLDAATPPAAPRPEGLLGQELTRAGLVVGTLGYMSPEQMRQQPVDARSDQFSFCVSLFEALHGRRPFQGTTIPELMRAISARALRPPRSPRVPPWLHEALVRGLSPEPGERFPSMEALLQVLAREPEAEDAAKRRARQQLRGSLLLGSVAPLLMALLAPTLPWRTLEERVQRWMLAARPRPWNPQVVVISIDPPTLRQLGAPLPRVALARMVEALS